MKTLKLFEKREYVDGGPNDHGMGLGYITAESEEQIREHLNIDHNFIQFREIDFLELQKQIGIKNIFDYPKVIPAVPDLEKDKEREILESIMDSFITGKGFPTSANDKMFKVVERMIKERE